MIHGPARLMEAIVLAAFVACVTFAAARIDYRDSAWLMDDVITRLRTGLWPWQTVNDWD